MLNCEDDVLTKRFDSRSLASASSQDLTNGFVDVIVAQFHSNVSEHPYNAFSVNSISYEIYLSYSLLFMSLIV